MIIDKGNLKSSDWNLLPCYLFTTSPHVVCPAMHTEQTPLANISYFAPLETLLEITRIVSPEKYIAGLLVNLRITSSQCIKKQGDFWGYFLASKMQIMKWEIRLIVFCSIKLITSNNYSPTNESLFCLLKLLTTDCESKRNWRGLPIKVR